MLPVLKKFLCTTCAAVVVLSLCSCASSKKEIAPTEPEIITLPTAPQETESEETSPLELVEHLDAVMAAGELYTLDHYPNLKSVNLSGSTCYGAIVDFMEQHPKLDVTYTVRVGSAEISNKETVTTLASGSYDYNTLLENLQYLPSLTSISLPNSTLDADQVNALLETYPGITLEYTVELLGNSYGVDTTSLDLSGISAGQVGEIVPKLGLLTNLAEVALNNNLSLSDVDKLQNANPSATFHYSFSLFGKTVSTTDEEVYFKNQPIGNEGEPEIRQAMAVLDGCKRFVLDNCKLDNEVLAKIREDFRGGPKLVWRVYFGVDGRYNTLTDDDTIRAVYNVTDSTCGPMKYLEDVKYMDLGHNKSLSDLGFLAFMPELECLIASESAVTDLSGIENCKKLLWLELSNCGYLENIEPLAGCESLKWLNLSHTKVKNLMPLDGLPLERFVCLRPKASTEEQNIFVSIHPKDTCITVFYGYSNPYGYGWRYNDNGKTMFWYYKDVIREVFNLDQVDRNLEAQKKAAGK
jgi:hypothetical protein